MHVLSIISDRDAMMPALIAPLLCLAVVSLATPVPTPFSSFHLQLHLN